MVEEESLPQSFRRMLLILAVALVGYLTALLLIVLALSPSLPAWIATMTAPVLVGRWEARATDSNWRVEAFAGGFAVSVCLSSLALANIVSGVSALEFLLANLFFTGTEAALGVVCGFAVAKARAHA